MAVSRREFFGATAVAGLAGLVRLEGQPAPSARKIFRHGVASGDPLSDRVILWTRVTAPEGATPEVQWEIAADNGFKRVVARGAAETAWERDFTVKIDASGLRPATTYYYRFQALGERSPIGRTRTLPASGTGLELPVRVLQRLRPHRPARRPRRRAAPRRLPV
jgi:phosphodiesterase/alkaline phosphatase D-like protein